MNEAPYREIDIGNWKRKDIYQYFKKFDSPFFNLTANIDVTGLYDHTKENKLSFFLSCLFYSTRAANAVEEFRYRMQDEKVICYDTVDPGCTIFLDDETFRYGYFFYREDLATFHEEGLKIIATMKTDPEFDPKTHKDNIIYYSVLPWLSFTSLEHPKMFNKPDSIPRIVFGKYFQDNNRRLMPVSVQVNHALMDGYHTSKYFQLFQEMIK
jgi:chloramphenicol O-acetyltransferase type A